MSVEAMAVVLHHSRARGTARLVLLGIANHQGDGGAWPSVATLARIANVSESSVHRAIRDLAASGELGIARQAGGGLALKDYERPNRYDVLVSCPMQCDRTMNHRLRSYPQDEPLPGVSTVTPGVNRDTPRVSTVTPEPSLNLTTPTSVETVTVPRAKGDYCQTCGKLRPECRRLWADDHDFDPPADLVVNTSPGEVL